MKSKALADLNSGVHLYHVWAYQAYHDITAKYKRTFLGSFWLAGGMVVTSISLAVLFGALFHQPIQQSLPYVMSGMLGFSLASYILYDGAEMFMTSGGIIKNHAYPFTFYSLHTVCKTFFLFLHNLVVYWLIIALIGAFVVPHWSLLLAIPLVLVFMFSWGIIMAMLASRFRDMRFMLPYLGQLLSYLTPIFWHPEGLPPKLLFLVHLNPMYDMVQIVRAALLGQMAPSQVWELAIAYTGLGVILWYIVFSSFRRRIPFWV